MERIAIVTDSDCELSPDELAQLGVFSVALNVVGVDGTALPAENTDENIERFCDYMESHKELPKTSMPSPLEFAELFTRLALEGYDKALVVLITRSMSGTSDVARMAAQSAPLDVRVVETRRNTLALGLIVRRLAQMREQGASFEQLVRAAATLHRRCNVAFSVDTLKNLVKGGRTGKATGLAAALLDIKPILTVDDEGEAITIAKVRSMKRALVRLTDYAAELNERLGSLEGYFVHVRNAPAVDELRALFLKRGIDYAELGVKQAGPVIATHVGIGTVGFTYIGLEDI